MALGRPALTWTSRQRLILFLAADVSGIAVLLIAILDEDLIGEFVIIFPLRQHARPLLAVGFPVGILRRRELGARGFGDRPFELALRFARRFNANPGVVYVRGRENGAAFGAGDRRVKEVIKSCAATSAQALRSQLWLRHGRFS
jgi:hypothetical protein